MKPSKNRCGFSLIEILVSMVIVSFLGGAIFVTFSQGVRLWQAAVREDAHGEEDFFFEGLRSELRNAFLYGKMALTGQADVLEFHALVTPPREVVARAGSGQVPAMIRYRYVSVQKTIQKETTFYEKMLYPRSGTAEMKTVLDGVDQFRFEFDSSGQGDSASVWKTRWKDTCFPGAIKITMSSRVRTAAKETRIMGLPSQGECAESQDGLV